MTNHPYDETRDLELDIVRQLDGVLGPDEELALKRELIRNPSARRMAEDYEQVDRLSRQALDAVLGGESGRFDVFQLTDIGPRRRARRSPYSMAWWMLPAAIAAAVAFAAVSREVATTGPTKLAERPSLSLGSSSVLPENQLTRDSVRPASTSLKEPARQLIRDVDRELLGVIGEDGNIYWLEVDRMRTIHEPNPKVAWRSAKSDF